VLWEEYPLSPNLAVLVLMASWQSPDRTSTSARSGGRKGVCA
jgi:hypothetical protein